MKQSYQKKASSFDEELLAIINDHKHFDLEQHMNHLITIIWENHFGLVEKVNATNIKNDDIMLFYAKIDRILILIKKKKIQFNYKFVKKYLESYLFSDIFNHPKYFIQNKTSIK